ncbi:hypothetical protein [Streptomyces liangshanensis]|uniref:Protein kilB n=1 Tax=Streptomyces liangshanensis TaxID=2717324 RepID=A0A6G9H8N0_9ACTN|nr:hypothetical protein [Streptomyces liangshanensis]QIQ06571.1 hypothetical protein HA039_33485 [Streptomyces liangshanensis]
MLATILAVLGTLLGVALSGVFALRTADRAEAVAARQQLRRDQITALTELAAAGSDHRMSMWMRGEAIVAGAPEAQVHELRLASHVTRSALTRPLATVQILIPDPAVRAAATELVHSSYRMRDGSTSTEDLIAAREIARTAHDQFVDRAAAYLATA